ncbi:Transmembrane protein GPR107/GPR108-like protein [Dioscorea alata]|uniref:Transmembrane protein GPR107/GPR108-like protein n=1 Tax=Dioscorea alata TaxID=55571 RepID=A0ACB7WDB0_DIOAL|nr:Transmembrane protein GPR107/GPR108-like protein [Dioscorea alata]
MSSFFPEMEPSFPSNRFFFGSPSMEESYHSLPTLYLAFLFFWCVSALSWSINTWRHRRSQWMMALVPMVKALQLGMSYIFWYSCIKLQMCSLWISFGVYVSGIIFQTAYFVSFMLISHGYCIMCERLSVPERRTTAISGCILYLALVGYKAAIPYFTVFLLLNYSVAFYMIFRHISQNLLVLHEQLNIIEDEESPMLHDVLQKKYKMFKKFQGTMQIVAVAEILVHINVDKTPDNYWFRLLVREWTQFCIFVYIGWTFRTRQASSHFSVVPTLKSKQKMMVPPIYSIEMDAASFKGFASQQWHVGVPTSFPPPQCGKSSDSLLVIVQHPALVSRPSPEVTADLKLSTASIDATNLLSQQNNDEVWV